MIPQFSTKFRKKYRKLDKAIRESFNERLEAFLANPFDSLLRNHSLSGEWEGHRSINITGDYRAIYYYDGPVARFVEIDTHHNLYGS